MAIVITTKKRIQKLIDDERESIFLYLTRMGMNYERLVERIDSGSYFSPDAMSNDDFKAAAHALYQAASRIREGGHSERDSRN